ncbi:ABC transporter permease [candidate division KSB1 bacterium]|nr:ABC transporter permease [candidate division KSB1 bacterium]
MMPLNIFKSRIFGIFLAFLLLCLFIGFAEYLIKPAPVFFKPANWMNILLQVSINAIMAVGMTFIIITSGIDLSVGSLLALCNVVLGLVMVQFSPEAGFMQLTLGIFATLATGGIIGFMNGGISVQWRIPPFIVTLGTLGVARGLALWLIDSQTENLIGRVTPSFSFIGNGTVAGIPFPALVAIFIMLIGHIILNYTVFGRHITAIGSNEDAARLCGIQVKSNKIWVYIIGGVLVAVAAVIQTSRLGSANPTIGQGFELYAIAAVIIGGTNLMGGEGSIVGTLVGALIIGVLNNGLTLMNIPDEIKQIIIGLVIIVAVLIDQMRKR